MTGITPSVGVPIAITGSTSLTGMTVAWAAGTAALDQVWKATASLASDTSLNGKTFGQAVVTKQPTITFGKGGKCGLLLDGVDDLLTSALNLPAPGTTPYLIYIVSKITLQVGGVDAWLADSTGAQFALYYTSGTISSVYGGSVANNLTGDVTVFHRMAITRQNTSADAFKIGATNSTGIIGNTVATSMQFGGFTGRPGRIELLAWAFAPLQSYAAADAALNTVAGYGAASVAT